MPANFPTSPSVGQRHTIADKTWEWTGAVWDLVVSTNTLQFSGDSDSTIATINLTANEEFRIVGDDNSITTTVSAGDSTNSSLRISLNSTIDVNQIQSSDSTNIRVADNLVPAADNTYSLGTPDRKWSALYVTGSTIFLGDIALQAQGTGSNAQLKVLKRPDAVAEGAVESFEQTEVQSSTATDDLSDVDAQSGNKQDGDILAVNDDSSNTFTLTSQLTTAIRIPSGGTADRPTAYAGALRYNTDTSNFEVCKDGSTFVALATAGVGTATITKDQYEGDGDTASFTLTGTPADANNVIVYVDGVMQEPGENYTITGDVLSFTASDVDGTPDSSTQEAPHQGARVVVMRGFDQT
jgi:hypothetical protein